MRRDKLGALNAISETNTPLGFPRFFIRSELRDTIATAEIAPGEDRSAAPRATEISFKKRRVMLGE